MIRMDILTGNATCKRSHINLTCGIAGMHIKAYDTQRVPYHHKRRNIFDEHLPHTTCKYINLYKKLQNILHGAEGRIFQHRVDYQADMGRHTHHTDTSERKSLQKKSGRQENERFRHIGQLKRRHRGSHRWFCRIFVVSLKMLRLK